MSYAKPLVVIALAATCLAAAPGGAPAGESPDRGGAQVAPSSVPIVLLRRSGKKAPEGSTLDVLVKANPATDQIARRVAALMGDPHGYGQFVLRLDRAVKNYLARDPGVAAERRASLSGPAYLFLSDRQGGFPVQGFWLEQPDGTLKEMRGVPFVDMVVDESDLVPGRIDGLEQIYAHELGHLMMTALAGPQPRRASSATHFVTVRTDGWTAFSEGWGEHFQPMGLDHTDPRPTRSAPPSPREEFWYPRFAREQVEGCAICPANLRFIWWQGGGEQRLRDAPLRANHFAHLVALPPRLQGDERPAAEVQMYRDVIPPDAGGPLKNPAQMLSSEGVVATLFYRLLGDPRLRGSYREPAFYAPFLPEEQRSGLASSAVPALVPPAENVYLKVFDVLHRSFEWGEWPTHQFVSAYAARFPEDAPVVYEIYLDVTRGVTVEPRAAARHASPGYLEGLRQRLLEGRVRLDANLGRPLWLAVPGLKLGMGVFRYFPVPMPITVDLNAADVADLRSVPGVSLALARAIVQARDARGRFDSLTDLAGVPGVTPELLSRLEEMSARMQARLEQPRRETGNPGWLMNYLVAMLKGSYYLRAAWQYGRALVLAGLAYLLVSWLFGRLGAEGMAGAAAAGPRAGRRRIRRALRALARGVLIAAAPCAVSIILYVLGVRPSAANMALVGAALGGVAAVAGVARRSQPSPRGLASAGTVAAWVVTATLLGAMY